MRSNDGVFHGSPISAKLPIIYTGNVMSKYTNTPKKSNPAQQLYNIRNGELGRKWSNYLILIEKHPKYIEAYSDKLISSTLLQTIDQTLFDGDASLDIPNIELIYPKLILYNNIADQNSLVIQRWESLYFKNIKISNGVNYCLTLYMGRTNLYNAPIKIRPYGVWWPLTTLQYAQ